MAKHGRFKKILEWFFEAEKEAGAEAVKGEEFIELNVWQAILLLVVFVGFLSWIFFPHLKKFMERSPTRPPPTPAQIIESKIEKNYFERRSNIENGDFTNGLVHWCTSDGGKIFKDARSKVSLDKNNFRSPPQSMKIESIFPANGYYYTKLKKMRFVDDPYDFRDCSSWLGIEPGKIINTSLWYKGDIVTFYLQCLLKDGIWKTLAVTSGRSTNEWKKLQITERVPESGRAIGIAIVLNRAEGMPPPLAWIDDVSITVK